MGNTPQITDAVIDLPEIGASLALADLYEGASFEDETTDLVVSEEDIG